MSLSQQQIIFLRMVRSGGVVTINKTAKSLNRLGLIKYDTPFGWYLTPEGNQKIKEVTGK
ncbi:MAG: hypothetical protein [Caudoviricetes sp.]|nr:MAG: hypothetical protein [Caudoviricetes sp.]